MEHMSDTMVTIYNGWKCNVLKEFDSKKKIYD